MTKRTIKQQIEYHDKMTVYNRKKAQDAANRAAKLESKAEDHEIAATALRQQVAEAIKQEAF